MVETRRLLWRLEITTEWSGGKLCPAQGNLVRRLNIVGLTLRLDWRRMQEQEVGRRKEGGEEGEEAS